MDAHLKHTRLKLTCLFALTCSGLNLAHAADFIDPTLPPAPAREESRTPNGAAPTPTEAPRLQMILRGPGEVRTAVVDGQSLRVGDTFTLQGEAARVIRITDSALHLKHADQSIETLDLAPDAAKAVRAVRAVKAVQSTKPVQPLEKPR